MAKQMVGAAPRRRRRTRAGVVLSEQLIIDTALRMLAVHGREGLSARRLATALDIDPSTLYRYFRSMDDLTLAVGDALIACAVNQSEPQGDWGNDLRALGLRIHQAYLDHPQAAVLTASRVSGRPHEIAADEIILSLLLKAGFSRPAAVRIYQVFIDQCLAFAALDAAEAALPAPARRADEAMWENTYARLPAATHPAIAATADLLTVRMATSAYPRALDMLLDAARGELAGYSCSGCGGVRRPVTVM
ncbi:TetR/AcrR family transcriptional regulator [Streptomyces sp. NPDC014889]|uniref:TetR/AcrR family transcriptional regulator n=1 Tax=Streptomyces sp. NPDC014889 TaxID=3364928 RepID=UPI0036FDC2ED